MKVVTFVLLLAACHQISAAGLPASLLSAKNQLADLKAKLDAEIAGLPVMPTIAKSKKIAALPSMSGKVPDFAGRKATLESLKAKMEAMQEQVKNGQPGMQFLAEMKQVLEKSATIEMKTFEVPKFKPQFHKVAKVTKARPVESLAKIELKLNRNVQNFTAEIFRLHGEGTNLHRIMLEDKRMLRNEMTDVVYEVFDDMVEVLGSSTERLLEARQAVQDLIDYDESIGAVADCVDAQKTRFAERNLFSGREMNFCTQFVMTPTRRHLATIFYPILEIASLFTSSMQYVIVESSSFTNFARDQEALIEFVENELHSVEEVWNNNMLVIFNWEQNRFDDEMLLHREELRECLFFLEATYIRITDDIKDALGNCAVPAKGRPMHLKPSV